MIIYNYCAWLFPESLAASLINDCYVQRGVLTTELEHPDHMPITAGKIQENGKKIKNTGELFLLITGK